MPKVVAYEDAKAGQYTQNNLTRTSFLDYKADTPDEPAAFLSAFEPSRHAGSHWHYTDEFIVFVDGKGKLGRHDIAPYHVHYVRGLTTYGPIEADSQVGLKFFVLYAHYDQRAQYLPESLDKLMKMPNRKPRQMGGTVRFGTDEAPLPVPGMIDESGLFAGSMSLAPGAKGRAPDPSHGDGQYLLVVKGSLIFKQRELHAYTLVHLKPNEAAFELQAGSEGLQLIVMNFPVKQQAARATAAPQATALKKWQCELCAFQYDEAAGMPDEGIAAGTRWEDVPDTWTCPDCAAAKSDFSMVEVD